METLSPQEIISKLIRKIQNDWERANGRDTGLSRIDRDILMDDLKNVYDLVYDLDIEKANSDFKSVNKISEKVAVMTDDGQQPKPDVLQEIIVDQPVDDELISAEEQPEEIVSLPHEEPIIETNDPPVKTSVYPQPETKSTLDLFSESKTLADTYQNDADNSLASKIQQNKISDIKTAIGINDKFLFINDIFRGEMSAYSQTIEKLNQTEGFHETLQIIDELKSTNGNEENNATFNKLVEVAKRRFH